MISIISFAFPSTIMVGHNFNKYNNSFVFKTSMIFVISSAWPLAKIEGQEFKNPIIFTGAVDELLDYKYGKLPYRSLDLVFENYDKTYYQTNSVVNYPNEEKFTRITEFKYLTKQKIDGKTTILKEYPLKYDANNKKCDPYYPITNDENLKMYSDYKNEIEQFKNIYLVGRLAEYKYYNMDAVIEKALEVSKSLLK